MKKNLKIQAVKFLSGFKFAAKFSTQQAISYPKA